MFQPFLYNKSGDGSTASPAMLLGLGLMLAGFCFKLSIVPFHMWAPDDYEGAPIPVTAMLAMASKAAGVAVFLRVFLVAFAELQAYWLTIVSLLAGLSMIVGIIVAIWQTNTKRIGVLLHACCQSNVQ